MNKTRHSKQKLLILDMLIFTLFKNIIKTSWLQWLKIFKQKIKLSSRIEKKFIGKFKRKLRWERIL